MRFNLLTVTVFLAACAARPAFAAAFEMPRYSVTGGGHAATCEKYKSKSGFKTTALIQEPRLISWDQAQKDFKSSKALHEPTAQELRGSFHLAARFEELSQLPEMPEMLADFRNARGNAKAIAEGLARWRAKPVWKKVSEILPSLVQDDYLWSAGWDPYKDESAKGKDNDGIYLGPAWTESNTQHTVLQGGVLMYASLERIKVIERDFAAYPKQVHMDYLEVSPLAGSYTRGRDAAGHEFVGLEVYFCQDLPFPYDAAKYTQKMLDHYSAQGIYVSDYYSEAGETYYWMRGRDQYFPVRDARGDVMAYFIATEITFDLKGIPESDHDRLISIKGSWGNIKRAAEAKPAL